MKNKHGVITFKARYGLITAMFRFVKAFYKKMKQQDPETIMIEEVNQDKSKTWLIGSSSDISKIINSELFVGDDDHEPNHEWVIKQK